MTVCVATISKDGQIFGASDRMLTVQNYMEYEPPASKILFIPNRPIVLMWAGHSALIAEVLQLLRGMMFWRDKEEGPVEWFIFDFVKAYQSAFAQVKQRWATTHVLLPLGMDFKVFWDGIKDRPDAMNADLTRRLVEYEMPEGQDIEVIIAGHDGSGCHLWAGHNGDVQCFDTSGFAAIGVGAIHATSQLMTARFGRMLPNYSAMVLTHLAKKRAEAAPGVGTETDMFMIVPSHADPTKWVSLQVGPPMMGQLEKDYRAIQAREVKAVQSAIKNVPKIVSKVTTPPTPPQAAPDITFPANPTTS
jgi:hypothetical protein